MFHEVDVDGNTVHWSPYSHKVESGVLYTDNGFWDTHRTCYPLLSLILPSRVAEMVAGFVNAAREGGWYPKWCSPGYRACMIGTHLDNVVSDAVVKGLDRSPADGTPAFDVAEAYSYLRKDAFEHRGDPAGCYGRLGLADYDSLGFVPTDKVEHPTPNPRPSPNPGLTLALTLTLTLTLALTRLSMPRHALSTSPTTIGACCRSYPYPYP